MVPFCHVHCVKGKGLQEKVVSCCKSSFKHALNAQGDGEAAADLLGARLNFVPCATGDYRPFQINHYKPSCETRQVCRGNGFAEPLDHS